MPTADLSLCRAPAYDPDLSPEELDLWLTEIECRLRGEVERISARTSMSARVKIAPSAGATSGVRGIPSGVTDVPDVEDLIARTVVEYVRGA